MPTRLIDTVLDPDEYFVPMGGYTNWKDILRNERAQVLKFRSTTAR